MSYGDDLDEEALLEIKERVRLIIKKKDAGTIRNVSGAVSEMADAIKEVVKNYDN